MYFMCNSLPYEVTCWSCALVQKVVSLKFVIFVRWPPHNTDHGCCVTVSVILLYCILHSFPRLKLNFKYLFFIYKGFSVSTFPLVIKIVWEVITTVKMHIIYFTQVPLFLNTIPKHIDSCDPSWHKFKNFFVVEINLFHSQQFMRSHFHFTISLMWILWPT